MEISRESKKVLPYININSEDLRKAIKSIAELCDVISKISPGKVEEKDLSIEALRKFSLSGDVFYSKCEEGKHIAAFIFKTFTKLAAVKVRSEVTQEDLDELNKEHISVLEDFVKKVKHVEYVNDSLYLSYSKLKMAK